MSTAADVPVPAALEGDGVGCHTGRDKMLAVARTESAAASDFISSRSSRISAARSRAGSS